MLLPTGVGQARALDIGRIAHLAAAGSWLPDGRHVLVSGNETGKANRLWYLDAGGGPPHPASPEGFSLGQRTNRRISPDGRRALCTDAAGKSAILDLASGRSQAIGALPDSWQVLRWHTDGARILVCDRVANPAVVWLLDPASGARTKVLEVPRAPAETMMRLQASDDLRCYAYSTNALLHDLYLMRGLR
jgi:hypothetical protein